MTILSKACKPDNFELHNLVLRIFEAFVQTLLIVNLSLNSPDIFALCETNLYDSTDSGSFPVRSYLPIIRKDSGNHMHGLGVYVKGLPFAWDLSLENSADSHLCF